MTASGAADEQLLDRVRHRLVTAEPLARAVRAESPAIVDETVFDRLRDEVAAELTGAGPLEALLALEGVSDVVVNAPDSVWIDRGAGLERTAVRFSSEASVRRLATRLAATLGRRLDDALPFVDGVLADGTRLHAVLPPLSEHTLLSLRVLRRRPFDLAGLAAGGTVPGEVAALLRRIVVQRRSFVVTGGTPTVGFHYSAAMSPKKSVRQCVVYARISVSDPKSVAIAHQLESCTKYAESRGWSIAGTFVDDGVSASKTRPEDRPGWRAMLDSPGPYQAVVALKLDRVARRAIDFLRSHEALEARGAAVVLVDDSIDMGSGSGKAYATILAALAEAEAAAISDRVTRARDYLLRNGRTPGGRVPFGYRSVENPRGAGKIIEQDPTTIEVLRDMVERALGGQTVHGISKELGRAYRGVEHALRHPILAGYILHNPGQVGHDRGTEVIRGVDGMPLVRPELAVITPAERRRLLDILDVKNKPQRMPRADRRVTSPFLSRIIVCDVCGKVMLRGTRADKKAALYCRNRCQSIDATRAADVIVERLLGERGDFPVSELLPDDDDDPQSLAEIDLALRDLGAKFAMTDPGDERDELLSTIDGLRELRARAAIEKPGKPINERIIWGSVREALAEAGDDDLARRAVLASQLGEIRLMKGIKGGRLPDGSYFDPSRIVIEWRPGAEPSEPTWRPGDDFEAVAS